MAADYLETAREAGRQMRTKGSITPDILERLNSCMMDRETYIDFTNGRGQ